MAFPSRKSAPCGPSTRDLESLSCEGHRALPQLAWQARRIEYWDEAIQALRQVTSCQCTGSCQRFCTSVVHLLSQQEKPRKNRPRPLSNRELMSNCRCTPDSSKVNWHKRTFKKELPMPAHGRKRASRGYDSHGSCAAGALSWLHPSDLVSEFVARSYQSRTKPKKTLICGEVGFQVQNIE